MATELRGTASVATRYSRRASNQAMLTARISVKMAVSTALCGLALVAVGGTARAQAVEPSARKPYAIRLGDFLPSDQDARRASGTHVFSVEADYTVQRIPERSSVGVLSVGYIERGNLRIVPITVTQIYREPGSTFLGRGYYFGAGVGVYTVRLSTEDTDGKVKHLFGGLVTAGLDITESLFADIKYHYISKYDNKFVGGAQVGVGVRF